ncbi:MAG: SDR family oxidoreductase [Chitinophagaceae bacterium]|nr:SDR family oxidoreductase [Chitinophagaceae bacterium]
MKILVTGSNGLLGQYLVRDLALAGHIVVATGRGTCRLQIGELPGALYSEADITDEQAVWQLVSGAAPDVIVHAAAMAQPDACELDKEACYKTNVEATRYFCKAASALGAKMVYISTDFIFSGDNGPYKEDDITGPVNYYGQSKLEAEETVKNMLKDWAIVRTVLVYGNILAGTRSNMVTWVKENLEKGNSIKVVNDQIRTPTYIEDLSEGIKRIIEKNESGIYHISGKEVFTPYEMALQVADYFHLNKNLMEKVDASVFTQPAKRPLKTGFIIEKAEAVLGYSPVSFKEGMKRMFEGKP